MRNIQFANDCIFHVYNRGVEKRDIFLDKEDYFRFVHNLFEFNDIAPAGKFSQIHPKSQLSEAKPPTIKIKRELIVEILCFCLMPNHYHLILRQLRENGIAFFMQKLGTGYTMYFNQKQKRVGSLFQGPFKAIMVENDNYLTHLSRYIHLNPVELFEPNWKNDGIRDWQESGKFLESYRWSSYPDYVGKQNFPSITNRDFILQYFDGSENYQKFINEWVSEEFSEVEDLVLEK